MASPVCSPSRGAMMTGCYPRRIGFGSFDGAPVLFPGHGVGLNPEETTIAKLLKTRGYSTQIIGKWHCGDQPAFFPTRHGFDHWYGLPYSNDMGRQVRRESNPPLPLMRDEEVIQQQPDQAALTERYVEEAVRFVREKKDEPFFYYSRDQLDAVRVGKWKLHVAKREERMCDLYDLEADVGETTDVSAKHPDVVADLEARLDAMRAELGDSARGMEGTACRPIGRVENPRPLTEYDPDHPYIISMYDLDEGG